MTEVLMFVFVLRMTQEQAARKPIVNAYYRYVGADQIVNDVQRQVPKDVLLVAGHVALITNVLTERRITVTFKF